METYQDRYTYLDNIRNILVYFVVFIHIICMFNYPLTFWWPTIDKSGSSRLYEILSVTLDIFLMPHLIFIAAFFIFFSLKNKSKLEYIKKRFLRLFVPIIIFTFCAGDIFYQMLLKRLEPVNPTYLSTFLDYWRDFLTFSPITFIGGKVLSQTSFNMGHAWFLSVLFFLTLFVMPFRNKEKLHMEIDSRKKIIVKTIFLSVILGFVYTLIGIIVSVKGVHFASFIRILVLFQVRIDQLLILLPLFLFGLYMYKKEWLTRGDIGNWKMWGIISAVLIFIYIMLFHIALAPTVDELNKIAEHNLLFSDKISRPELTDSFKLAWLFILLLKVPICIFLLMFFLTFAKKYFNKPNKITAFCSKHSINVYLFHFIPVLILQDIFVNMPIAPIIRTILMLIIVIPACLWLSYRFVSPYPVVAISFFIILKLVALFMGFDFYNISLLAMLIISFAGALYETIRLLMPVQANRQKA